MNTKNIKKVLSSFIIATYLVVHLAPMGLCITNAAPQLEAGVMKPALRSAVKPSTSVSQSPTSLKLEGDLSITKSNPKISLSLRNSDVRQVLRMFADKAGLNIIFHESVGGAEVASSASSSSTSAPDATGATAAASASSGTVTLDLVNVPLNDAFRMVMQVSNLTYFLDNNTMIIMAADAAKTLNMSKQEMMIVPVKYVDASKLATFLNKNIFAINKPGLSNADVAITNPSTNEILIFGTKNDYTMAKKVVEQFDVKPKEKTFVVNHTTPKEMADLICSNLLGASGGGGASSSSSSSSSDSGASSDSGSSDSGSGGAESGGAAGISGSATGFASELSLGAGVIACQATNAMDAGALSSLGTSSLSVTYFAQRGTISVMGGSAQQMEMIKEFIATNDKKQQQAYLEISIVELNEDGSKEFNNTWNVYSPIFSASFEGGDTGVHQLIPSIFGEKSYVIEKGASSATEYLSHVTGQPSATLTIDYIIKNNKGRSLANPRIMITNGQESTIDLSSDYVKTVTSQIITTTGSGTPSVQKTFEIGNDDGIKVSLTPFISPDGYVTLNIKPEYATIKGTVNTFNQETKTSDLAATLLQRRNLDLKNVRIKDNETLIIGGMNRETETKEINKIPFLGDLPGVGMLFRNTKTIKAKQELVIMITPKIIKDTEDLVNNSGATL